MKPSKTISLIYHDYFDYPLTQEELVKWQVSLKFQLKSYQLPATSSCDGYFFLKGHDDLVTLRQNREIISQKKLIIAHHTASLLKFIPTIKMVGITGSLAMNNCHEKSDIDFMIVTSRGTLWTTRLFTLLFLKFMRVPVRSRGDKNEKDKLCLNIWMDENDLVIHEHNLYTAHELAQVVPLINRGKTYERLLLQNFWIKNFWPNAVKFTKNISSKKLPITHYPLITAVFEKIVFRFQYQRMKKSITNETVTRTRAFFHPINWSKKLESHLTKSNIRIPCNT